MTIQPHHLYGALVVSVLLLTLLQPIHNTRWAATIMVVSWFGCNFLVKTVGFVGAPNFAPVFDGMLALTLALIDRKQKSMLIFNILCLFWLEEVISIAGIAFSQTGTTFYYAASTWFSSYR